MPEPKYITHENAHARPEDLNPKVNGPFLDELNADRERARFESRNKAAVEEKPAKKAAAKKTAKKASGK